ncbi:hypothetical protein [Empedobacter brevis]|uniref:hypothetical protein n=1 Tax=Empedobacter brevis TaxID=247 RepID=UPI00289F018E|nr:hypothetical protein [Empedobacter brevis]
MKKKILFGGLVLASVLTLNFITSSEKVDSSVSRLDNLKILNASAGEAYCKPAANPCIITVGNFTVSGSGIPTANF